MSWLISEAPSRHQLLLRSRTSLPQLRHSHVPEEARESEGCQLCCHARRRYHQWLRYHPTPLITILSLSHTFSPSLLFFSPSLTLPFTLPFSPTLHITLCYHAVGNVPQKFTLAYCILLCATPLIWLHSERHFTPKDDCPHCSAMHHITRLLWLFYSSGPFLSVV